MLLDDHRKLVGYDEHFEVLAAAKEDFAPAFDFQTLNIKPDISGSWEENAAIIVFKFESGAVSGHRELQFVEDYAWAGC